MVRQDANVDPSQGAGQDAGSEAGAPRLRSASPEETRQLGALLGRLLQAGDVVLLTGELGAGKTAFTQGIGAGLGVVETINSPTFTLVKEYAGRRALYHFDLYRIEEPDELFALGFEDYFDGDGVSVVEWAERGEPVEGDECGTAWQARWLRVHLSTPNGAHPSERLLELTATGERGLALLEDFVRAATQAASQGTMGSASAPGGRP